jgi:hypothetical protein
MKLQYKKMVEDICKLVETDFCGSMEMNLIPRKDGTFREISQENARELIDIVSKVYLIAHCIHCEACQHRYSVISSESK